MINTKSLKNKRTINNATKIIIFGFSFLSVSIVLILMSFIFIKALPMFKDQNWATKFNQTYGIVNGLITTFVIAFFALTLAMWIGTRIAIMIHYKIKNKKIKSIFKFITELLAGIPSVIFGLFGIFAISPIMSKIFSANFSTGSVYSVIVVLTMMIIPTISSLTLNALKGVPSHYYDGSLALGNTSNQAIYKVVLKSIRKQRIIIMILSLGRVIGETMAVSMLIQSHPINPFNNPDGFFGFLKGNSGNIATIIPNNMFPQSGDVNISRGYVYAIGVIILVFILLLNIIVSYLFRTKKYSIKKQNKFSKQNERIKIFINYTIFHYILIAKRYLIFKLLFFMKNEKLKSKSLYHWRKNFSQWFAFIIGLFLVLWIFGYILIKGGSYFEFSHLINYQHHHGNTVGKALLVTLLLVFGSISISFPFAFSLAIWFSEFANKSKLTKIMRFLIDSLQSTPSILFGMFGMALFIQTLHMGRTFSMSAGVITMSIVILPMFTRVIEQSLQNVPQTLRDASLALGATKVRTIFKIVIPTAGKGMITGVILSIGRIISETAPVYLVMGLSPAWHLKSNAGAQVITTRIYVNVTTPADLKTGNALAWEAAFVAMILIIALYLFANFIGYILTLKSQGKLRFKRRNNAKKLFWN